MMFFKVSWCFLILFVKERQCLQCPFAALSLSTKPLNNDILSEGICGSIPMSCSSNESYRSYDGSCNNLANPSWGTTQSRYGRLLPANYADGHSSPTVARSGNPLPEARLVSFTVYPKMEVEDPLWTLIVMQFGQFISHDMSLLISRTNITCCTSDNQPLTNSSKFCFPILVPENDTDYSPYNITCLPMSRSITDEDQGCIGNKSAVEQLTQVNNFLDLSLVYGNTEEDAQELRNFTTGKLISETQNEQEMLPIDPDGSCVVVDEGEPCYLAGDSRVNQNPQLTILHTIFLREHNRIATKLSKLNPHWDDEQLYQEARKINIAQFEQISYYEWLPILIGLDNAYNSSIIYDTDGFVNDYNDTVDPSVLNEFSTAAFRFFHTLIDGYLKLLDELRSTHGKARISNYWNRPVIIENHFDYLLRGLTAQLEQAADVYHDKEITNNWLRDPNSTIGQDLKAICVQRNRDHGLASYNDMRVFCGLPRAETFDDFLDVMNETNVQKLASLYEVPDDVDLTVGGSLENIINQTLVGPTIQCILTKQFYRSRVGDRFWYENSGATGFTLGQLKEIRKATISRLICDNTNDVTTMQPNGFKKISLTNALVLCDVLPSVDLTLWLDSTKSGSEEAEINNE